MPFAIFTFSIPIVVNVRGVMQHVIVANKLVLLFSDDDDDDGVLKTKHLYIVNCFEVLSIWSCKND